MRLVVAHVGDSQAVLCRDGNAVAMTHQHKPEKAEKARIEAAGGFVARDAYGSARVNGVLEMSRSIGDTALKQYGVICEPEVKSLKVNKLLLIKANPLVSFCTIFCVRFVTGLTHSSS